MGEKRRERYFLKKALCMPALLRQVASSPPQALPAAGVAVLTRPIYKNPN
jgi:hypothetical protein